MINGEYTHIKYFANCVAAYCKLNKRQRREGFRETIGGVVS